MKLYKLILALENDGFTRDLQVQLVAVEVEILLHARDISIIDILLVKIFNDWSKLALLTFRKAPC